jgi:hypothetical protein
MALTIANGTYNILNYGTNGLVGRAVIEDRSTREKGIFCPPPEVRDDKYNVLVSVPSSLPYLSRDLTISSVPS